MVAETGLEPASPAYEAGELTNYSTPRYMGYGGIRTPDLVAPKRPPVLAAELHSLMFQDSRKPHNQWGIIPFA